MYPNLELEMFKANISSDELAKRCGVCGSTMRNKRAGKSEFTLREIKIIAKVFPDHSIDYLFECDQEPAG